jgi:peptide-methionine (R)-S-oxide reductase
MNQPAPLGTCTAPMTNIRSATRRHSNILLLIFATGIACPALSFASVSFFQKRPSSKGPLSAVDDNDASSNDKSAMGTWNPLSLAVLKLKFTEPAWTSPLNYKKSVGIYQCAYCRSPLFSSAAKYDSGSGWPSFWKTIESDRVSLKKEWDGRIECLCGNCGGHLGELVHMEFLCRYTINIYSYCFLCTRTCFP